MDTMWHTKMFLNKLASSNKNKVIKGAIAYYKLQDWWLREFSTKERTLIEDKYKPMRCDPKTKPLTEGDISSHSASVVNFLTTLSGWFNDRANRNIAIKIISRAEELSQLDEGDILDKHFLYSEMIATYYPERIQRKMFEKATTACEKQISLAPKATQAFLDKYPDQPLPSHRGYGQLEIVLAKQKKYKEAIKLCEQARDQGWQGNWDKSIERHKKRVSS